MKPELIVMLTNNDVTVKDAKEQFIRCKDLPITHWGFKDVGLPRDEMRELVKIMREAGKITSLEVVSLSEEKGLEGTKLAVEMGFDNLMGTVYFNSIHEYLKGTGVKYYPFIGDVHGHPSILDGTIEGIVGHAKELEEKGVEGIDLLTYRYTGDAKKLLEEVVKAVRVPVVSAGSVKTLDLIEEIESTGAWGFTIGSALFNGEFTGNPSFKENLEYVCAWIEDKYKTK